MKYLTFMTKQCLDDLLYTDEVIVGDHYNATVNQYVFGVIPEIDDVVAQTVLLLTYMAYPENTACVRFVREDPLPLYNAVEVNNSERHCSLAPKQDSLAVVHALGCADVERSYYKDDVTSFHELLQYHLSDLLKLLGHEDFAKVRVDWNKVREVWTVLEKTGILSQNNYAAIKSAVTKEG